MEMQPQELRNMMTALMQRISVLKPVMKIKVRAAAGHEVTISSMGAIRRHPWGTLLADGAITITLVRAPQATSSTTQGKFST